jgi:PPOX class probable F420-dependent enzyme
LRRDGRAQSSDIALGVSDGLIRISVTADRAKTRNMTRDRRVVLHVTDPPSWSYVSFDGTVELTPPAVAPDDATVDELVELYELVSGGAHSDWDEFRAAMVTERRQVVRFTPRSVTGQVH